MTEKQVRDYDKFMLRFPDGMRDAIAERAKANGRSMNSEIVQILQDALDGRTSTITSSDEIEMVYADVMSINPLKMKDDDFNKNIKKMDWLIGAFMQRIGDETHKVQSVMRIRSQSDEARNKKPT